MYAMSMIPMIKRRPTFAISTSTPPSSEALNHITHVIVPNYRNKRQAAYLEDLAAVLRAIHPSVCCGIIRISATAAKPAGWA